MILAPDELGAIKRQAVDDYPHETCGVILARGAERRLVRCRNIQNELHAKDPVRHPRDARTAYYIDPADLLNVGRLEGEGFTIGVIYHSHIDAGAYFSETDKRQALLGQDPREHDPMYPDAVWLVASVVAGRVAAVAAFRWNATRRDFLPVDLEALMPSGRGGGG